jgi:hypothetical protein
MLLKNLQYPLGKYTRAYSPLPWWMLAAVFLMVVLPFWTAAPAIGNEVSVKAAVEKRDVYVGEPFLFQVQVEGADAPAEPDLSSLQDFQVQPRGGQQNNSESITIINGRMERVTSYGYIFNYGLTPKRAGNLTIPELTVQVDGRSYQTRPVSIVAREPAESSDFKLRMQVSKTSCYVGEPLVLTVTWYVGKDVDSFAFNVPLLDDQRFLIADDPEDKAISRQNSVAIPLGNGGVVGKKGRGRLDGQDYLTVSFRKILIPLQAGTMRLPKATVSCRAVTGYRHDTMQDPFANFFGHDFMGRVGREVYETVIAPSNEPELTVTNLPAAGRPAGFSGLVGEYRMSARATPTKVGVGDPITLTVEVTGPAYLENLQLPSLNGQAVFSRDFKIPEEMAAGQIQGQVKTFTQTLRARNAKVVEIPSLTLSYFNPATGRYETAATDPIPLAVKATRVVTARDAEGRQVTEPAKQELTALKSGIAYNYDDLSVLENQDVESLWLTTRKGLLFILMLPGVFLLFWGATALVRHSRKDPAGVKARKAMAEFNKTVKNIAALPDRDRQAAFAGLAEAIRIYLGTKLRMAAGAITYQDVEERLAAKGVAAETLARLKRILDECEAHRYAGMAAGGGAGFEKLVSVSLDMIGELERSLR